MFQLGPEGERGGEGAGEEGKEILEETPGVFLAKTSQNPADPVDTPHRFGSLGASASSMHSLPWAFGERGVLGAPFIWAERQHLVYELIFRWFKGKFK